MVPRSHVDASRSRLGFELANIASLHIVEVDQVVLERAAQPMPTELGTLGAIHLATALLWRDTMDEPLTMATHDAALAIAAEAHGLQVVGGSRRAR